MGVFCYLFFAGWRDNFTESNTNSLSLVWLVAVQTSLQDRNDLGKNSFTKFANKVSQGASCNLEWKNVQRNKFNKLIKKGIS